MLLVFISTDARMEQEMDRHIRALPSLMVVLPPSVMV